MARSLGHTWSTLRRVREMLAKVQRKEPRFWRRTTGHCHHFIAVMASLGLDCKISLSPQRPHWVVSFKPAAQVAGPGGSSRVVATRGTILRDRQHY